MAIFYAVAGPVMAAQAAAVTAAQIAAAASAAAITATITNALVNVAFSIGTNAIIGALTAQRASGENGVPSTDIAISVSTYGKGIPIVLGSVRIQGNVIDTLEPVNVFDSPDIDKKKK
jgi:hypothetical protein